MKMILLVLAMLVLSPVSHSQEEKQTGIPMVILQELKSDRSGTLKIEVIDVAEPVYQSYRMTISIKCKGKSSWEKLVTSKPVCDFAKQEFDKKKDIVKLYYSTSEPKTGEAKCDTHWAQDFDLKELCADD